MEIRAGKQYRTKAERRAIVEESLRPGTSVSQVARAHDVNTNQVFEWRRQYREGRLNEETNPATALLPVKITAETTQLASKPRDSKANGSKGLPIRNACELHWQGWCDDRTADRNADLDCSGNDGSATRIYRAQCAGANGS
jgi:transposase-like protein